MKTGANNLCLPRMWCGRMSLQIHIEGGDRDDFWLTAVKKDQRAILVGLLRHDHEIVRTVTLSGKQVPPFTEKQSCLFRDIAVRATIALADTHRARQCRMRRELTVPTASLQGKDRILGGQLLVRRSKSQRSLINASK